LVEHHRENELILKAMKLVFEDFVTKQKELEVKM